MKYDPLFPLHTFILPPLRRVPLLRCVPDSQHTRTWPADEMKSERAAAVSRTTEMDPHRPGERRLPPSIADVISQRAVFVRARRRRAQVSSRRINRRLKDAWGEKVTTTTPFIFILNCLPSSCSRPTGKKKKKGRDRGGSSVQLTTCLHHVY